MLTIQKKRTKDVTLKPVKNLVEKCLFVDQTGSYPMFNMFIEFGCVLVFRN